MKFTRLHNPPIAVARFSTVAVTLALAASTGLGLLAGPASASTEVDVQTASNSTREVLDFWTPKRMRNAEAIDLPTGGRGAAHTAQAPGGGANTTSGTHKQIDVARHTAAAKPAGRSLSYVGTELPWRSTGFGYAAPIAPVGRVWMVTPQGQWSNCSGTVVATNIVVTAAHCVRDGKTGAWSSNLMFTPAVNGSSAPYGSFVARRWIVPQRWAAPGWNAVAGTGGYGYFAQDYAFLVLNRNSAGRHVASYTGSFGLLANAPRGSIYHLGYPSEGRWGSCTFTFCRPWQFSGPIQRYSRYAGGKHDVGMSGYNSGGSSGGPWFQQYGGRWYVASVQSHMGIAKVDENGARFGTTHFGPYFDNDMLSVFAQAKRL